MEDELNVKVWKKVGAQWRYQSALAHFTKILELRKNALVYTIVRFVFLFLKYCKTLSEERRITINVKILFKL